MAYSSESSAPGICYYDFTVDYKCQPNSFWKASAACSCWKNQLQTGDSISVSWIQEPTLHLRIKPIPSGPTYTSFVSLRHFAEMVPFW